jgi:hypothetical protein
MEKELIIKHANIIFTEFEDKGFGQNITIDVTDPTIRGEIQNWITANNINGGKMKIKEYTSKDGITTQQFQMKLSKFLKIAGKDSSWNQQQIGYGAVVNLILRAFEYNNKFGTGISFAVSNIFIVEPAKDTSLSKIAE